MLDIEFAVEATGGYTNDYVELNGRPHTIKIRLLDGEHTFESEPFDLGILPAVENRRLLGQLTFRYSFDEKNGLVTVCGTDFDSSEAMCLLTVPEGTSEFCYQRASSGGFLADDLMANLHWNYRTLLTPGLDEVFTRMARSANESLIAALTETVGLSTQVRMHPPELTSDEYLQLLTVYRDGTFLGLYEQGQELGPKDMIYTVESVFGGEVTMSYGEAFANVIGSTPDPKIGGLTWIMLWAKQFGMYPTQCTSYLSQGFHCGPTMVGGHVVSGKSAKKIPNGSNSVYIYPICIQHNNNDSVYMEALTYLKGIWLKNYMGS